MNTFRIAVIGPESSGKSALSEKLALHYNTIWIPEYARTYLPEINRKYTIEDVVAIYKVQFEQEQLAINQNHKLIFIDTEFIIAKVWCEHVFGFCPPYFDEMIEKQPYDFYLLSSPDLPWEYDPLRENPGKGELFFTRYNQLLERFGYNYGIVEGIGETRLQNAIQIVDAFIQSNTEVKFI